MSTATHTVGVNDTRPDVAPGEFGLRLQKSDGTSAHAADVKLSKRANKCRTLRKHSTDLYADTCKGEESQNYLLCESNLHFLR